MEDPPPFDPALLQFATPRQREGLEAWLSLGSSYKAAEKLGITDSAIRKYLQRARLTAHVRGYSPEYDLKRPVGPGQFLSGASTLYRLESPDGEGPILQWVKSSADARKLAEAAREFATGLADEVRGKSPFIPSPADIGETEIATHYKIGDQHLGMYAWGQETGDEDYDLRKSTADVIGAIDYLVAAAPETEVGVLVNVGDFLHANDRKSLTPGSGNLLDTDGRHGKVARRAAHIMRHAILRMLEKHSRVDVINARGNHDPDAAVSMQVALEAYFENNPRVNVFRNDRKVQAWTFGETLVLVYHGEKNRRHQFEYLVKAFQREVGQAAKVYVDNGHVHHKQREEIGPMIFEVWNALTAVDLYHADNLYGASRSMTSVVYHKRFGEVSRNVCDLRMIRERTSNTELPE